MSKTVEDIGTLKINLLSQAQYDAEKAGGRLADDELYLTPSSGGGGGASAFIAEYGVTTYADVKDAYDEDAIILCTVDDSGNTVICQLAYYDDANGLFYFAQPQSDGFYLAIIASDDTWDDSYFTFASTDTATQLRDGLMSALDWQKLDGIESGAEVNVQSDWNQSTNTADDYIKNKPTIPTVNNATLTIQKNGTTVDTFTANASSNVTANITVPTKVSDLNNDSGFVTTDEKLAISEANTAGYSWYPIIGSGTTAKARNYCGNFMFVIGSGVGALPTSIKLGNNQSGNSNSNRYGAIELYGTTEYKTELNSGSPSANRTISLPNNDGTVALTSDLPTVNNATLTIQKNGTTVNTFTANASSNVTANITVPTDTGDLTNGAGYITTETDPTVPSWAKQVSKPSYTASEVGALPDNTTIPSKTSDLVNDSGFITGVTSTSTPTASTIAEFDSSAHMNSADMSAQDVSDFVDDLDYGYSSHTVETKTLLWTNDSPTSAFSAQTVVVDTSYDAYEIVYTGFTSQPDIKKTERLDESYGTLDFITGSTGQVGGAHYVFKRQIWKGQSGVGFGELYSVAGSGNWGQYTANTGIVPYKIYGLKTVTI